MWPLRLKDAARFDVVGVGASTDDHLCVTARPAGIDVKERLVDYLRQPGGQVPTALVALQRWGARTAYVGALGDDDSGTRQRASLLAEGVDVSASIVRPSVGSHTSVILIDQISGARTVLWHEPASLRLRGDEIDRELVAAARMVLLDDDSLDAALLVARWARESGTVVVLDIDTAAPEVAALIALADIVIVADDLPQRLTGTSALRPALRALARRGPTLAMVTLGAGGALAAHTGRVHFVPAFRVPAVDTTSAGDVFHAGVMHGVLQQWNLRDTLRFASAAAALTCTVLGGRAAIPALTDLQRLLLPLGLPRCAGET